MERVHRNRKLLICIKIKAGILQRSTGAGLVATLYLGHDKEVWLFNNEAACAEDVLKRKGDRNAAFDS